MQPVNDDMDDLFRRAADSYPLNTGGADFDKVSRQFGAEATTQDKKEGKRRYLWLLLLLVVPFTLVLRNYLRPDTAQVKQIKKTTTVQDANINTSDTTVTNNKNSTEKSDKKIAAYQKKKTIKKITAEKSADKTSATLNGTKPEKQYSNADYNKQPIRTSTVKTINILNSQQVSTDIKSATDQFNEAASQSSDIEKKLSQSNNLLNGKSGSIINEKYAQQKTLSKPIENNYQGGISASDAAMKTSSVKKPVDSLTINQANKKSDTTNKIAAIKKPAKKTDSKKLGIYIGLIAGPDVSVVKSGRTNGLGYNLGFIAGYNTGRRLSFETGISWNNKKYYSKGKYLSAGYLMLPSHSQVIYVNGSCNMIEIPFSIRYRFYNKGENNWYTGAGISSYIMKEENYFYQYRRYNTDYYRGKNYKNSTQNWASVLQVSAGYQVALKHNSSLRFEPYIKLPLKKIGIGKLPVSGTGVNVSFTLPVF